MPFTGSARDYIGPQLLYGGIMHGADAMAEALKQYEQDKSQAGFADTVVDFLSKNVPGSISPDALQRYHKAGNKEKAMIALGGQWNAIKGLGAYQSMQAINQPFMRVDGQLFRRPGAPVPATVPTATLNEQGRRERFLARQRATQQAAQVKLAENQMKTVGSQLADIGYTGDPADLLNPNLHKGGYLKNKTFVPSDPRATDPTADKTQQTHIQIGGGDTLDLPTFNRAQRLAQRHMQLQQIVNSGLQSQAGLGGGAGGTAAGGGIVTVTTPAEAAKLSPGTRYRAPDGKVRVIPYAAGSSGADEVETATDTDNEEEE